MGRFGANSCFDSSSWISPPLAHWPSRFYSNWPMGRIHAYVHKKHIGFLPPLAISSPCCFHARCRYSFYAWDCHYLLLTSGQSIQNSYVWFKTIKIHLAIGHGLDEFSKIGHFCVPIFYNGSPFKLNFRGLGRRHRDIQRLLFFLDCLGDKSLGLFGCSGCFKLGCFSKAFVLFLLASLGLIFNRLLPESFFLFLPEAVLLPLIGRDLGIEILFGNYQWSFNQSL
jgi:hypothetical protein